ncbi:MAG: GNAT family N-acetyltransferase [Planctomycetes bacterium]|nr:GNAT family N-acetyltransferase [Planctomycetota bacterium]
MAVLQLTKQLKQRPCPECPPGIVLRHYQGEEDIEPWLALRRAAFARQRLGVRDWSRVDFEAEFLARWWWRPQHMWLAEAALPELFPVAGALNGQLLGTITLAFRGDNQETARPVVHWLAVHPAWRRQGVGKVLIILLEMAAWDMGYRQIWLETHADWKEAEALYLQLGYI